jgi:hypothetical protein
MEEKGQEEEGVPEKVLHSDQDPMEDRASDADVGLEELLHMETTLIVNRSTLEWRCGVSVSRG